MTTTAYETQVAFGSYSLTGLMDEQGTYYIDTPILIKEGLLTRQDHASRDLKTLLGKEFGLAKLRVEYRNTSVTAIALKDFEVLLAKLDRKGNKAAQKLRDDLVGLSLHQLFSDAFNVTFGKKERQQWLTQRQIHQCNYNDRISAWLDTDGVPHHVRGHVVNTFKKYVGVPIKPVDTYNSAELAKVNEAQNAYQALRTAKHSHQEAIDVLFQLSPAAKYPPLEL